MNCERNSKISKQIIHTKDLKLKRKKIFLDFLTAKYDYPNNWKKLFKKANYKGDYYWTVKML